MPHGELSYRSNIRFTTPRRRKRRTTDRGRLVQTATIICAALGIDTDLTLIYQLFSLLLCLVVLSRLSLVLARPRVSVKRRLPRYATAGEPFDYFVDVVNEGVKVERDLRLVDNPKTRHPTLEQYRNHKEPGEDTRNAWDRWIGFHRFLYLQRRSTGIVLKPAEVPDVPVKSKSAVRVTATPLRRGIVGFRSTTILHPDPMGLAHGVTEFDNPEQLMVLPRRYHVPKNLDLPHGRHFQPGGVNSTWSVGESDEFVSLRDYRDGDSMRKIHWPSTARRVKPVVKEYQEEYQVRQAIVLDTHADEIDLLEEAVSVTASFLLQSDVDEFMMDLIYLSTRPELISAGRGQTSRNRQLETLACIQASQLPVSQLGDTVLGHAGRLSGCFLVLSGWSEDRRSLIERLAAAAIPLRVFVIARQPHDQDIPASLHVLDVDNVEEELARL